jgi:hypothetical protein
MKYRSISLITFMTLTCLSGCVSYNNGTIKQSLIDNNLSSAYDLDHKIGDISGAYQIYKLVSLLDNKNNKATILTADIEKNALPGKPSVFNFYMDKILGGRFNRFNDHWRKAPSIIASCYPLNVLLDSLDIVDFHVGLGGTLVADAHATRALQAALGGGVKGDIAFFEDKRSPLAFAWDKTGIAAIGPIEAISTQGESTGIYGLYQYSYSFGGLSSPYNRHNQFYRDYWAIGAHVGAIVDVGFDIHPIEILDLILG